MGVHFCNHVKMEQERELAGMRTWLASKNLAEVHACMEDQNHSGHAQDEHAAHDEHAGHHGGSGLRRLDGNDAYMATMDHSQHTMSMSMGCGNVDSNTTKEFMDANMKMHSGMAIYFSCSHDVDFVRGMIPHHAGANVMCDVMTKAKGADLDPFLSELCVNITRLQRAEIAWLAKWLTMRNHSVLAPCRECTQWETPTKFETPCDDMLPSTSFCHMLGGDFYCKCESAIEQHACGSVHEIEGFGMLNTSAECARSCGHCMVERPPVFYDNACAVGLHAMHGGMDKTIDQQMEDMAKEMDTMMSGMKGPVVTGSFDMTVPNATEFMTDKDLFDAVLAGLAIAVGAPQVQGVPLKGRRLKTRRMEAVTWGTCNYNNPFSGDVCMEMRGDTWTDDTAKTKCDAPITGMASQPGTLAKGATCAPSDQHAGWCSMNGATEWTPMSGDCNAAQTACTTWSAGVWTCEAAVSAGPAAPVTSILKTQYWMPTDDMAKAEELHKAVNEMSTETLTAAVQTQVSAQKGADYTVTATSIATAKLTVEGEEVPTGSVPSPSMDHSGHGGSGYGGDADHNHNDHNHSDTPITGNTTNSINTGTEVSADASSAQGVVVGVSGVGASTTLLLVVALQLKSVL